MSNNQSDISMSPDELYLEEVFTDNKVGTIRRMTPVTSEGLKDDSRETVYIGSTQMMTPAELQEMRRQQASQIVVPGQGSGSQIQIP